MERNIESKDVRMFVNISKGMERNYESEDVRRFVNIYYEAHRE